MSTTYTNTNKLIKLLQCPNIVRGKTYFDYRPVNGTEKSSDIIFNLIGGRVERVARKPKTRWRVSMWVKGEEHALKFCIEKYPQNIYFHKGEILGPKEAKNWIIKKFYTKT